MKIKQPLLSYQLELLKATHNKYKIIGFIAGTGAGKTFFLPFWLLYIINNIKSDSIIIISSPTVAMIKRTVLRYITQTFDKYNIKYELNKVDLVMKLKNSTIYFISATEPDKMQGIHADYIFGDEAGLFSKKWLEVAIQRTSFQKGKILLTTTPYSSNHWLKKDIYDDWKSGNKDIFIMNVPSWKNPFYPIEEFYKAKNKLPEHFFRMLYLAEFPTNIENQIFTEDLFRIICNPEWEEYIITCDVAREGNDRTVIVHWKGNRIIKIDIYKKNTIDELVDILLNHNAELYLIDETGLGAGVVDYLKKNGRQVKGINFSNKSNDRKYLNKRSELYFKFAELLKQGKVCLSGIKQYDELKDELLSTEYTIKKGKLAVIDKEQIKDKLGKSPDLADAVVLYSEYHGESNLPLLL